MTTVTNLKRLEILIAKHQLWDESGEGKLRKVMCRDASSLIAMRKTRTHNIQLVGKELWWENNYSRDWNYSFESEEEAQKWWKEHLEVRELA